MLQAIAMSKNPGKRDNQATFFLSTGRCGTQWLADSLGGLYSDIAHVEHEPYQDINLSRQMLGMNDPANTDSQTLLLDHVAKIKEILRTKDYIECGWPCWGLLRWLATELKGRIRIVHLVRHPVHTVFSWASHNAYTPPLLPGLPSGKLPVTPFDNGVSFSGYTDRWGSMNSVEKSLYFWLEVNTLGVRLEKELAIPWLRVKSEEIFGGDALMNLINFLKLPQRDVIQNLRSEIKDSHRFLIGNWWDYRNLRDYPEVIELCRKFGYDPFDVDEAKLRERYLGMR